MKKILSITLIVVLILTSFVSVGAEPSDYTYTKEPVSPMFEEGQVISDALQEHLDTLSAETQAVTGNVNTTVPVYVWLTDIDQSAVLTAAEEAESIDIEAFLEESSELSAEVMQMDAKIQLYESQMSANAIQLSSEEIATLNKITDGRNIANPTEYSRTLKELATKKLLLEDQIEQVDEFIATKRAISVAEYEDRIDTYILDNQINEEDIIFRSRYAPMVIVNMPINDVTAMAEENDVVCMDLFEDKEAIRYGAISKTVTRADININNGYTGNGVKIGILEPTIPVSSESYTLVVNPQYTTPIADTHATMVCRIIKNVAPGSSLYCTAATSSSQYFYGMEELLDASVHVVNLSMGFNDITGTYDMISQWTDHITSTDNVTVVAASGNSDDLGGDYAVASPAKGYNVIAVGNFNDNNTISIADDTLYETSCYLEKNNTAAEKPDVLAPGTNITIDNYEASGTSFAAPHVTGILAQLMQQSLALRSRPSLAKSLITVGARYKIDSDSYSACGIHTFSDKEGAGKVDARNASTVLGNMRYYYGGTTVFNSGGSIVQNVNVTSADVLFRVSLTWERKVTVNSHTNGSSYLINVIRFRPQSNCTRWYSFQ